MISDELTGGDSKNRKEQEDCVSCPSLSTACPGVLGETYPLLFGAG